jgi:hypothetical protein
MAQRCLCWQFPHSTSRLVNTMFNVFHVRALYYTKTLITNECTKRILSSIVTHSYMFRPCWVIFRENFCYRYTMFALYSWVRMCCWLCTVYWRRELSAVPACTAICFVNRRGSFPKAREMSCCSLCWYDEVIFCLIFIGLYSICHCIDLQIIERNCTARYSTRYVTYYPKRNSFYVCLFKMFLYFVYVILFVMESVFITISLHRDIIPSCISFKNLCFNLSTLTLLLSPYFSFALVADQLTYWPCYLVLPRQ